MSTLLVSVIIVMVVAWLISLVVQLQGEIRSTHRRGQVAQDKEQRLRAMIEQMRSEEKMLTQQIHDQSRANVDLQRRVDADRAALVEQRINGRGRVIVMSPRRQPGERDWIVTLANPTLQRLDPSHPLAEEWQAGRDYLVYARNEAEARDRITRRFNSRPGVVLVSSGPLPTDMGAPSSLP